MVEPGGLADGRLSFTAGREEHLRELVQESDAVAAHAVLDRGVV